MDTANVPPPVTVDGGRLREDDPSSGDGVRDRRALGKEGGRQGRPSERDGARIRVVLAGEDGQRGIGDFSCRDDLAGELSAAGVQFGTDWVTTSLARWLITMGAVRNVCWPATGVLFADTDVTATASVPTETALVPEKMQGEVDVDRHDPGGRGRAIRLGELAGGRRGPTDEGAEDSASGAVGRVATTAPGAAPDAALTFSPVMLIVSTFAGSWPVIAMSSRRPPGSRLRRANPEPRRPACRPMSRSHRRRRSAIVTVIVPVVASALSPFSVNR